MYEERMHFFDNLRLFIVILVVVLHASVAYGIYSSWWFIHDTTNHFFFDIFITVMDLFLMPSLFFIAGYFTLSSINNKTGYDFIKNKMRRIVVPWLVGMLFYIPILQYLSELNTALINNIEPKWYGFIWLDHLKNITSLQCALFVNNQKHFWFLSLLFYFYITFFILHIGWEKFHKKVNFIPFYKVASKKSIITIMILTGLLCSLWEFLSYSFTSETYFLSVSLFLDVQISKIFLYIIMFSLGIIAYSGKWFITVDMPGHVYKWAIIIIILGFLFHFSNSTFYSNANVTVLVKIIRAFSRSFITICTLIVSLRIAIITWNHKLLIFGKPIADYSYDIYLFHLPIVVLFQILLFHFIPLSPFIKFAIVSALTLIICYISIKYLIRPFPKIFIGILLLINIILLWKKTSCFLPTLSE